MQVNVLKKQIVIVVIALLPAASACGDRDRASTESQSRPPTSAEVRGVVLDATDDRPLAYSNVVIVGTSKGAMAGDDGRFTIYAAPHGLLRIKVMHMCYETLELEVFVDEQGAFLPELRIKPIPGCEEMNLGVDDDEE